MSYRRFGNLVSAATAAVLGCVLAPNALQAQDPGDLDNQVERLIPPEVAAADPNTLAGKESTEGVYVRDSALALEKFNLAQKMERLKEWDKSADLYQEVIEKFPDRVVPSRLDAEEKIVQYTSVTRGVMERLAKWPKDGLDVYRARFEPSARQMLDAAGGLAGRGGNLAEMHRIVARYFVTETAKEVALRLVDVNLERGEFQSAARLADELLTLHPDIDAERPMLLYRAAMAHRLGGDTAKAKERLAALAKNHADAIGSVRGKEVKLADSLAAELQGITTLADAASAASAESWTTYGGDASRGRVAPAGSRPGARLFGIPILRPAARELPQGTQAQLEQLTNQSLANGQFTGVFPVVDRGELFFQDGTRVFARSLESGNPLPGWLQTYPGEREGQYILPNTAGSPRLHQLTLSLTERAVLGVMGQLDRHLMQVGAAPATEPRLVSLDRQTGKENWVVAPSSLELPKELPDDQQKAIRTLQMNGSPLVVGDSVLVTARGVKQAQFEDAWVLCFDLNTGKYRWSCYVASASNVGAPWGGGGGMQNSGTENAAHLAYANGRVYFMSNLGALAALDAYSGTIVWLDIYERGVSPFDPNQGFNPGLAGSINATTKPWLYNPVIVKDGYVFALPTEGKHLYVYDANTGSEVKRIRRSHFGPEAEMLLAVMGDRMVLASERKVFCLNWRAYDESKYDPERSDSGLVWSSVDFPDGLRGRPFVTNDFVFVTNSNRLSMLTMKGGRVHATYPKEFDKNWDESEEGPGNLLVTASHVVIAGASHVYGYTDLGLARARLDQAVAAAPADAGPRLRYAEILFAAGEPEAAIAKLDETVALLGGAGAMRPGPGRDWLFNLSLAFAKKIAGENREQASADAQQKLATSLFDRAGKAASSPQQQVHYRLSRAKFAESVKDAPTAAKLYQELLSEPELRPVPLLDETSGGPTQAAMVAEDAIRSLVARAGSAVYAPFEQAASKQLAEAKAATPVKPEQLLAVAEQYPNAAVAPQALLAAADAYEAAGSPRPAVQVLRQIYFKYPEKSDKARVLEAMARNYLALPNRTEVAAARLAQSAELAGQHKLSKPMRLPDGRELALGMPFTDALAELRKFSGQEAAKGLPDFGFPVPARYPPAGELMHNPRWPFAEPGKELVVAGVNALATPLRDHGRADRVIAWSADGSKLTFYKPGDAKPVGTTTGLADAPKGSAWVGDGNAAVVWSDSSIVLANETGGEPAWRVVIKDLPNVEVVKPPGGATVAQQQPNAGVIRFGGQIQFGARRGVAANQPFVMQNGIVRIQPQPAAPAPRPDPNAAELITEVRPVGDRILVSTSTGRLASVDAATGKIAWQTRLSDRTLDRVVANEDFTVVKVSDEATVRLVAMDTVTGQIRGTKSSPTREGETPVNLALAADGTLVYTTPSRLMLKDLYQPWDEADRDATGVYPGQQQGVPPFLNATAPDQLVIAEGRILALAESGSPSGDQLQKYVRVHSLETGKPILLTVPQEGGVADLQLQAGTDSWDIKLRVLGPRLYIVNPRTIRCYNLDDTEEYWGGFVDVTDDSANVPNVIDAFFGRQHVVLLSQPGIPERRKGVHELIVHARYPASSTSTAESGKLEYLPIPIIEQPQVTAWQPVENGFYYHTADGKLHFLTVAK